MKVNSDRMDQEVAEERILTQVVLEVSCVLFLEDQLANTRRKNIKKKFSGTF